MWYNEVKGKTYRCYVISSKGIYQPQDVRQFSVKASTSELAKSAILKVFPHYQLLKNKVVAIKDGTEVGKQLDLFEVEEKPKEVEEKPIAEKGKNLFEELLYVGHPTSYELVFKKGVYVYKYHFSLDEFGAKIADGINKALKLKRMTPGGAISKAREKANWGEKINLVNGARELLEEFEK